MTAPFSFEIFVSSFISSIVKLPGFPFCAATKVPSVFVTNVNLALIIPSSFFVGSIIIELSIFANVVAMGIVSIFNFSDSSNVFIPSPSCSIIGLFVVNNAAAIEYDVASNKLPASFIIATSANTEYTCSPSLITILLKSTIPDSRIPLSETLLSSIVFGCGGPGSYSCPAIGKISAFTINRPSFGLSGLGLIDSIFIPAMTSVSPNFTLAEPFAFSITPVSISNSRC